MKQANTHNTELVSEEILISKNGFYLVQPIGTNNSLDPNIQELDTPHDHSCMFWGIVLGLLLPQLHDINQFKQMLNKIFGEQPDFIINSIYKLLLSYSGNVNHFNPNASNAAEMLLNLINDVLRKKVSDYLKEEHDLISQELSNVDAIARSKEIIKPHVWGDDTELLVLSLMFNVRIEAIREGGRHIFNPYDDNSYMLKLNNINQKENDSNTGHYHFLINHEYLNNAIHKNLNTEIDENNLTHEPIRQASKNNRVNLPTLTVEQIRLLLNCQQVENLAYISNEQKINQTLDYLIQFGIRLSQSIGFERIRQHPVIRHPTNFFLNKKFPYLSGFALQAASYTVTDNTTTVTWLSAVATLLGANGYSFLKTIEVTNNNYKDIQEAVRLAQLLYNNPNHRANLSRIFFPAIIHSSINTLLSVGLLWGSAWSLTDEPYKTIGRYMIFTCLVAFVISHMVFNSLIKNARSPIQDNLNFIRFAAAFELARYYYPELENYSPDEQYVIQRLLFQHTDLALYCKNQKLTLEQSLWLLSRVGNVFTSDDLLKLHRGHLTALLDFRSPFNLLLNKDVLSKESFMQINNQHLIMLSAYFSLDEKEQLQAFMERVIKPLLEYLQTQPQELTKQELKVIVFAIANKFRASEIKACQQYSEAVYQWHKFQHLPPDSILHYLSRVQMLSLQPEQLIAISYDRDLLDILSAHSERAKSFNTQQLVQMKSGTNYRKLLKEGKLTITDPVIENSERLILLNQLDSGLLTGFNQQDEYTISDLLDSIQENPQDIESFNKTYSVNIQQLLVDMKNWNEPSQNDNDVVIDVHSPVSPTK